LEAVGLASADEYIKKFDYPHCNFGSTILLPQPDK